MNELKQHKNIYIDNTLQLKHRPLTNCKVLTYYDDTLFLYFFIMLGINISCLIYFII